MWKMPLTGKQKPLIVIVGPTAIGKTGLAITLAKQINGEIISADSRQIYRHMDIGTAKPTPDEQQDVPHHMLDVVAPDDNLSLANYQAMTVQLIDDIHQHEHIPLLVGGTGQYTTAVTEGWTIPEVPPNNALRAELEQYAKQYGRELLYARLEQIDPLAATKIHPNNVRRVIRAIEVCTETGEKFSELQRKQPPPYAILELGLTIARPLLYDRADKRVDQMLTRGFIDEVRRLHKMGYSRNLPSMSGLGYAELSAHLLDDLPLEEAVHNTKIATHRFIRRQYTWYRGHDNGIKWYDVGEVSQQAILDDTLRWINEQS